MLVPCRDKNNLVWSQKKKINLGSSLPVASVFRQINLMPNWRQHLQNIKGGECAIHFEWRSPRYDGCFLTVLMQWKDNTPPLLSQEPDSSQIWHPVSAADYAAQSGLTLSLCPRDVVGGCWATSSAALPSLPLHLTRCRQREPELSICSKSITWHPAAEKLN